MNKLIINKVLFARRLAKQERMDTFLSLCMLIGYFGTDWINYGISMFWLDRRMN